MQSLKRSLMLLKPGSTNMIKQGAAAAALKLKEEPGGLSLCLEADCLTEGEYSVYLFMRDKNMLYAGNVNGGRMQALMQDTRLEDISGAAVIHSDNEKHTFCLKSTGMDWTDIVQRFKIQKNTNAQNNRNGEPSLPDIKTDDITLKNVQNMFTKDKSADTSIFEENSINEAKSEDDEFTCENCPHVIKHDKINPFPSVYPQSEWIKISYPGPAGWWHYISGNIQKGSSFTVKALGVPGEYALAPPIWLEGFGTYMRCSSPDAKGYWLMFLDAETGEVLDPGLSPHYG